MDPRRINEIVHGQRSITADTALRLSRYFGTSERFWLNLQSRYDLELQKMELGERLEKEVSVRILQAAETSTGPPLVVAPQPKGSDTDPINPCRGGQQKSGRPGRPTSGRPVVALNDPFFE